MQAKYLVWVPMLIAVAGCREQMETRESETMAGNAAHRADIYVSEDIISGRKTAPLPRASHEAIRAPYGDQAEPGPQPPAGLD